MLHRHTGRHLCAANSCQPMLFTMQVAASEHPSMYQSCNLLQVTLWGSMRSYKHVFCQEQAWQRREDCTGQSQECCCMLAFCAMICMLSDVCSAC